MDVSSHIDRRLHWRRRARGVAALTTVLATAAVLYAAPADARDDDEPRKPAVTALDPTATVPDRVIVDRDELDALEARLTRAVFRVEAQHSPPEPYQQTPVRYDGAAVAVRTADGQLGFLTSASWLEQAESIHLLDPEGHGDGGVELAVERRDLRVDLALLRATDVDLDAERFEPLELATRTPMVTWTLLSPQTPTAQLTTLSLLPSEAEQIEGGGTSIYWPSTLSAVNGYPAVDADGRLVALHARLAIDTRRGQAVGWPSLTAFLAPESTTDETRKRATPRTPDRVLRSRILDKIRSRDEKKATSPATSPATNDDRDDDDRDVDHDDDRDDTPSDDGPFRYRFGGNAGHPIQFGRR